MRARKFFPALRSSENGKCNSFCYRLVTRITVDHLLSIIYKQIFYYTLLKHGKIGF
jgi:hypothetical protein